MARGGQMGDAGSSQGDAQDPQILHKGDQPGVGSPGIGHDHHGFGPARRSTPDAGGARHDAQTVQQPPQAGAGGDTGQDDQGKQMPARSQGRQHGRGGGPGYKAADDGLGQDIGRTAELDGATAQGQGDGGDDGAKEQCRRQFQGRQTGAGTNGQGQQRKPLAFMVHSKRPAGESGGIIPPAAGGIFRLLAQRIAG